MNMTPLKQALIVVRYFMAYVGLFDTAKFLKYVVRDGLVTMEVEAYGNTKATIRGEMLKWGLPVYVKETKSNTLILELRQSDIDIETFGGFFGKYRSLIKQIKPLKKSFGYFY